MIGTTAAALSDASEAEDAVEMGEEHLNLLPELHRDAVLAGSGRCRGRPGGRLRVLRG